MKTTGHRADRMLDRLQHAFENYRGFTSDVSNELRTPLTIIKGEITLALQKDRDINYYRDVLNCIDSEIDRLARLSGQMLLLARVEEEKMHLRVRRFNLLESLTPLLKQVSLQAQAKNIRLEWQVPVDIFLVTDSDVLRQIVLNLLDNAVKYRYGWVYQSDSQKYAFQMFD